MFDIRHMVKRAIVILFLGDLLTLALVTVYGFANHQELGAAGGRILATFIPLLVAWLLVAPFLGVYDPDRAADPRQLWRPFWAMVLAGPMAALLRGMMLGLMQGVPTGQPIQPIFVVVIGGISALALLAWRALYVLAARRMISVYG
jgi:hypothetical protein